MHDEDGLVAGDHWGGLGVRILVTSMLSTAIWFRVPWLTICRMRNIGEGVAIRLMQVRLDELDLPTKSDLWMDVHHIQPFHPEINYFGTFHLSSTDF